MKTLRTTLLVLACFAAPAVFAQWQWIDKDGRKVFSDQSPPADVPASKILKRPGNRPMAAEPVAAASSQAPASAPKVSGKDKELEAKRKAASAAEADRKQQQDEQQAKARAENCENAKRAKATYDSGIRVSTTNAKGEREFMSAEQRAAEIKRIEAVIASDCKPG